MYTAAFAHAIYTIIKQISYNQNMDALMSENLHDMLWHIVYSIKIYHILHTLGI